MSRVTCRTAFVVVFVLASLALFAACDDESTTGGPTATGSAETPSGGTPAFGGGREPQERTYEQGIQSPIVVTVRYFVVPEGFDRLLFDLEDGTPDFLVQYVDPPITECASGRTVDIEGEAFLQVRMSPLVAHFPDGKLSANTQEVRIDGPSMIEAKQTCDFEGVVTWVIGLTQEVDFRTNTSTNDFFTWQVVVDALQP